MGIAIPPGFHLHQRQQGVDALPDSVPGNAPQAEGDVLRHGQVGKQGQLLENHAHPPLLRGNTAGTVGEQPPVQPDATR